VSLKSSPVHLQNVMEYFQRFETF